MEDLFGGKRQKAFNFFIFYQSLLCRHDSEPIIIGYNKVNWFMGTAIGIIFEGQTDSMLSIPKSWMFTNSDGYVVNLETKGRKGIIN